MKTSPDRTTVKHYGLKNQIRRESRKEGNGEKYRRIGMVCLNCRAVPGNSNKIKNEAASLTNNP